MNMLEHYHAAERLMVSGETAQDPSRMIGLAQAHLAAAQFLLAADAAYVAGTLPKVAIDEVTRISNLKVDPDGRLR